MAAYQNKNKDKLFASCTRDVDDPRQYRDTDDNPVTLRRLVKLEPEWARNRIIALEADLKSSRDDGTVLIDRVAELKQQLQQEHDDYEQAYEGYRVGQLIITSLNQELDIFKAACDHGKLDRKALDTLLLARHKQ